MSQEKAKSFSLTETGKVKTEKDHVIFFSNLQLSSVCECVLMICFSFLLLDHRSGT